jgi:hypothetical protein
VLGAGLRGACDPGEPMPIVEDDDQDDPLVRAKDLRAATHVTNSLDGTPGFVHIGNLFSYAPPLFGAVDLGDADAVRQHAVTTVYNRLDFAFAVIGCDADLQTDDDRSVSLDMQGCQLGVFEIDADVEATAQVVMGEGGSCDAEQCATQVRWSLAIGELKSGLIGFPKSGFIGPIDFVAPIDSTERMQWQTGDGFAIETGVGLTFDTLSTASWLVREDSNCIEIDMGARLSLEEREDELDELIGDLVVSARGIDRCPGQCATAGDVEISFGAGQVIRWTHDTDDTITVVGPLGREVEVTPPCVEQRPGG